MYKNYFLHLSTDNMIKSYTNIEVNLMLKKKQIQEYPFNVSMFINTFQTYPNTDVSQTDVSQIHSKYIKMQINLMKMYLDTNLNAAKIKPSGYYLDLDTCLQNYGLK